MAESFFQGDTLSVAEVAGFPVDALYFTDVNYTFLVNRRGTSVTGSYLFSKFRIYELRSLQLKRRSYIATAKVNQAIIRTRSFSSDLFPYFDHKQIQNIALKERVSFDKLRVLTIGVPFDHFPLLLEVVKDCGFVPPFGPGITVLQTLPFAVPGFDSSYFNLSDDYFFLPFFLDKRYVEKIIPLYYSVQ